MNLFKDKSLSGSTTRFLPQVAGLALVAMAYWVAVRFGLLLVAQPEGVASIWPASGLALAILLLTPKSQWPKLLAVIFITNAAGNLSGGTTLPVSLGFALANTLEAFLGGWALIYFCKSKITFERTLEIFILFGVAILCNGITALLGAAISALAFGAPFFTTWLVWWTSDGLGMILVAPLIVTLVTGQPILQSASPRQLVEAVALIFVLTAFAWLLFGPYTVAEEPVLRNYMLFPLLIWLAFRYNPRGMVIALMLLTVIAIWNTLRGYGIFAFAGQTVTEHLVSLQMLLTVITFSGLFLSAMLTELKHAGQTLRESEALLFNAFNNSPLLMTISDLSTGKYLEVNDSFCMVSGFNREEAIGRTSIELGWISTEERTRIVHELQEHGKISGLELTLQNKGGKTVICRYSGDIIQTAQGNKLFSTAEDISDLKQAEEALRESENRFHSLYDNATIGIYRTTPDGRILLLNPAGVHMLGYDTFEEIAKRNLEEEGSFDAGYERIQFHEEMKREGTIIGLESIWKRKDGSKIYIRESTTAVKDGNGTIMYYDGTFEDITERKQVETALHLQSEIISHMAEAVYLVRMDDGVIVFSNSQFEELFGYGRGEMLGKHVSIVNAPTEKSPEKTAKDIMSSLAENGFWKGEVYNIKKDGTMFWSDASVTIFDHSQFGKVLVSLHRDITERKQSEEQLASSEIRYRRLFEAARDGILILAPESGMITDVNPFLVEMLGFSKEEICGKELWELGFFKDIAASKANFLELLQKEYIRYEDLPLETAEGRRFRVEFVSNVYQVNHHKVVQCNIRDITERRRAEQQLANYTEKLEVMVDERTHELQETQDKLVRHEKLAVLGQMASSVGHELRNPLSVIASAIYYLKLIQPNVDVKIKEYLGIIDQEVHTSEKIITDLLDFARVKSVELEAVSVSELIHQTLERFPVPASVEVTLEIPPDLPQAYVDVRQITQVLGNLTVNACQAMTGSTSGVPKDGQLLIYARLQSDMMRMTIQDNGEGISPENMKKLFEPLFTTKAKGIGLGLAVSQKLVDANGGRIEVESEPGKGSSFHVFLPIFKESV